MERGLDGAFQFRRPDGRPLPEVPHPATVPTDSIGALRADHFARGLDVHSQCPGWLDARLDVGWAIDVLHPLATQAAANWQ